MLKEYQTVSSIYGPLMLVESVDQAKFGHIVDVELGDGTLVPGQPVPQQSEKLVRIRSFPFRHREEIRRVPPFCSGWGYSTIGWSADRW